VKLDDDQNFTIRSGSRDGAVARALALYQCGMGSIPAWCHMWVDFVVLAFALRVFLLVLQFSSLHKNQHFKFKLTQDSGPPGKPVKADAASSLNIVV